MITFLFEGEDEWVDKSGAWKMDLLDHLFALGHVI